jgi:hypothetical protein
MFDASLGSDLGAENLREQLRFLFQGVRDGNQS